MIRINFFPRAAIRALLDDFTTLVLGAEAAVSRGYVLPEATSWGTRCPFDVRLSEPPIEPASRMVNADPLRASPRWEPFHSQCSRGWVSWKADRARGARIKPMPRLSAELGTGSEHIPRIFPRSLGNFGGYFVFRSLGKRACSPFKPWNCWAFMVLRERIELSTSPLPRECSTTELPQLICMPAREPEQAGGFCHSETVMASASLASGPQFVANPSRRVVWRAFPA